MLPIAGWALNGQLQRLIRPLRVSHGNLSCTLVGWATTSSWPGGRILPPLFNKWLTPLALICPMAPPATVPPSSSSNLRLREGRGCRRSTRDGAGLSGMAKSGPPVPVEISSMLPA